MGLGKQPKIALVLGLLYPYGRPRRNFWLLSDPALATVTIWGMNQQMENLFLSVFTTLSVTLPLKSIQIFKKENNPHHMKFVF